MGKTTITEKELPRSKLRGIKSSLILSRWSVRLVGNHANESMTQM
jgi:hypothetical protein